MDRLTLRVTPDLIRRFDAAAMGQGGRSRLLRRLMEGAAQASLPEARDGERLNPRKADLQVWRETFAAALRDRGVEAEATPRRARGVVRKPERVAIRRLRERFNAGQGPMPVVLAEDPDVVRRDRDPHPDAV